MSNPEKQKKEKTKQYKVTVSKEGFDRAENYLKLVNESSKRKIRLSGIVDFAIEKLCDRDIQKIQDRAYTPDDRLNIAFEEYNKLNSESPKTKEEFKMALLDAFEKQISSKRTKNMSSASSS